MVAGIVVVTILLVLALRLASPYSPKKRKLALRMEDRKGNFGATALYAGDADRGATP